MSILSMSYKLKQQIWIMNLNQIQIILYID